MPNGEITVLVAIVMAWRADGKSDAAVSSVGTTRSNRPTAEGNHVVAGSGHGRDDH